MKKLLLDALAVESFVPVEAPEHARGTVAARDAAIDTTVYCIESHRITCIISGCRPCTL